MSRSPRSILALRKQSSLALLLAACTAAPPPDPTRCDPRELDAGEVRVRQLPCTDELPLGGDARRTDWVLENASARFFVRDTPGALTRLGRAGGTIIDATAGQADDVLLEAVPLVDGQWFLDAQISTTQHADSAQLSVTGTLPDGSTATVTYRLGAESQHLEIDGAGGISLAPTPGTEALLATLDDGDDLLGVLGATAVQDLGGWLTIDGAAGLLSGDREAVYERLYTGQRQLQQPAEGDWVTIFDDALVPIARLPIQNSLVDGRLPAEAAWMQAIAEGGTDGPVVPIGAVGQLVAGPAGTLQVRATDQEGNRIPVTAAWQGRQHVALPEAPELRVAPGQGTVTWFAGPGRELLVEALLIPEDGAAFANVALPWAVTPGVLAALDVTTAPDPTERRDSREILSGLAGAGVQYAVMVATDEVSSGAINALVPDLHAATGSRSAGTGTPSAWPWAASQNKRAHGAADWEGLSAEDLLAVMSRRDSRTLMVRPGWLDAAETPPAVWLPPPDLLYVSGLDDLEAIASVYDRRIPLSLAGPLTWVDGVDPQAPFDDVDVEAGLLAGRTTATNGPRLLLSAGDASIGDTIDAQPPLRVRVRVEAPTWIPLTQAELIGPAGVPVASWALEESGEAVRLEETIELDFVPSWLILAAWGEAPSPPWLAEPAWAISSALWLERP